MKVVRVVAEVDLRVNLRDLKVWVALEAYSRIHLYKLCKGTGALNVLVYTGGMSRLVRAFVHCV